MTHIDSRLYRRGAYLFVATALAACSEAAARNQTESAQAEATPAVQVQAVRATDETGSVPASGVVEAIRTIDVSFQVGGKVIAVNADEGQEVRAGSLLAAIDSTDYSLSLEQSSISLQRERDELARLRALHSTGSLAQNDLEKADAGAKQAMVAASLATKRLGDTRLFAPISGVVARRAIDPSETAAPGVPVFTIVQLDPMEVRVGIPEADIGAVRVGQHAAVTIPALAGRALEGRVSLVGVAADPTTRTYTAKITVRNPERVLKSGMVAEARIAGQEKVRAITIPGSAIVRDAEGATLAYVLDSATGVVHARRVEVGPPRGLSVEIIRGLADGEVVVIAGQHRIREGTKVRAVSAKESL